jgi:hypothetical protein
MKTTTALFLLCLIISGCASKNDKPKDEAKTYNTPEEVVAGFNAAYHAQDSTAIVNVLASVNKDKILSQLNRLGGFKTIFEMSKSITLETKVVGVMYDSTNPNAAKVIVNGHITRDSVNMNFDSLYFGTIKEGNSWKMLTLNAQPMKKYDVTGQPQQ